MCKLFSSTAARQASLGPPAGCSVRDEIFKHYSFSTWHYGIYTSWIPYRTRLATLLQYGSAQKNGRRLCLKGVGALTDLTICLVEEEKISLVTKPTLFLAFYKEKGILKDLNLFLLFSTILYYLPTWGSRWQSSGKLGFSLVEQSSQLDLMWFFY